MQRLSLFLSHSHAAQTFALPSPILFHPVLNISAGYPSIFDVSSVRDRGLKGSRGLVHAIFEYKNAKNNRTAAYANDFTA